MAAWAGSSRPRPDAQLQCRVAAAWSPCQWTSSGPRQRALACAGSSPLRTGLVPEIPSTVLANCSWSLLHILLRESCRVRFKAGCRAACKIWECLLTWQSQDPYRFSHRTPGRSWSRGCRVIAWARSRPIMSTWRQGQSFGSAWRAILWTT